VASFSEAREESSCSYACEQACATLSRDTSGGRGERGRGRAFGKVTAATKKNCRISLTHSLPPCLPPFPARKNKKTGSSRPSSSNMTGTIRSKCGSGTRKQQRGTERGRRRLSHLRLTRLFALVRSSFSLTRSPPSPPSPPPLPPPAPPIKKNKNKTKTTGPKTKKQLHQVDPGHLQVRRLALPPAAAAREGDPGARPGVPRRRRPRKVQGRRALPARVGAIRKSSFPPLFPREKKKEREWREREREGEEE
jgi:hypothetical protein